MDLSYGTVDEAELMEAVPNTETYLQTVKETLTRTKKYPSEEGLESSNYLI
jgi:hypothetical protein